MIDSDRPEEKLNRKLRITKGSAVSKNSPRGTYLTIAEALRERFASDSETAVIPSEASLMDMYGVSRNTIRRALKTLQSEGILESSPGVGWRVLREGDSKPLADRVKGVFADDLLAVGDRFPSESELCMRFDASRTAVRRVLAQLEGTGMLQTVHGKGRTVQALPVSPEQP
ncbi:GntR family transcriptional regulator [Streptomyces sp. NPDC055607]